MQASMQDSTWQVASHVNTAFQASANLAASSMAGRVLFPFRRWNDCGKADATVVQYSDEHSENNSVPTTTSCDTMPINGRHPVEGHAGRWKLSANNLVVANPRNFGNGVMVGTLNASTAETFIGMPGSSCLTQEANHVAVVGYNAMKPTRKTQLNYDSIRSVGEVLGTAKVHNTEMQCSFGASAMEAGGHGGPTNDLQIGPYDNELEIHGAASQHRSNMISQSDLIVQKVKQKSTIKNSKKEIQMKSMPHISAKICKQSMPVQKHPTVHAAPRCQIDGCKQDLSKAKKDYHRRHKVCEMHSKAASVLKAGLHQRFCQQCSRFHVVGDFDDAKRSCRRRLEGHNRRRRKPTLQGYGKLIDLNQVLVQHHPQLLIMQQAAAAAAFMASAATAPLMQQQQLAAAFNEAACNKYISSCTQQDHQDKYIAEAASAQLHDHGHLQLIQCDQQHLQYDDPQNLQLAAPPLPPQLPDPLHFELDHINNRLLTFLNPYTKGSTSPPSSSLSSASNPSSSASSSSPSLFNHSSTTDHPTCALSLLSCHPPSAPHADQPLTTNITDHHQEKTNLCYDNIQITNYNHLSNKSMTMSSANYAYMIDNSDCNNNIQQPIIFMQSSSSSTAEAASAASSADIMHTNYALRDYWRNLGLIQSLGQHSYSPNFIAHLLRQSAAAASYNHNPPYI